MIWQADTDGTVIIRSRPCESRCCGDEQCQPAAQCNDFPPHRPIPLCRTSMRCLVGIKRTSQFATLSEPRPHDCPRFCGCRSQRRDKVPPVTSAMIALSLLSATQGPCMYQGGALPINEKSRAGFIGAPFQVVGGNEPSHRGVQKRHFSFRRKPITNPLQELRCIGVTRYRRHLARNSMAFPPRGGDRGSAGGRTGRK